jgi:hypothetical protein
MRNSWPNGHFRLTAGRKDRTGPGRSTFESRSTDTASRQPGESFYRRPATAGRAFFALNVNFRRILRATCGATTLDRSFLEASRNCLDRGGVLRFRHRECAVA